MATVNLIPKPAVRKTMGTDTVTQVNNPNTVPNVVITLDAVISETHNLVNTVTDHPVEQGADISDHSRPEPDGLTMECLVSDTPLSVDQQNTDALSFAAGKLPEQDNNISVAGTNGQVPVSSPNLVVNQPGYSEHVFAQLKLLRDTGTLMSVVPTLGPTYNSMAIVSIQIPRDAKTYEAIRFLIVFKRVRIVQNKLTRNVVSRDKRVGKKQKTGNKVPETNPVETSALEGGIEGAAGKDGALAKIGGFVSGALGAQ